MDTLDAILIDTVQSTAEQVLGSYNPILIRSTAPPAPLDPTDTSIHNITRQYRRLMASPPSLLTSTNSSSSIEEEVLQHYETIFAQSSPTINPLPPPPPVPNDGSDGLHSFFTNNSIKRAIRSYPRHKAPGLDNITQPLLFHLTQSQLTLQLRHIFIIYANFGITPASWCITKTILLPKNKHNTTASNTRPIALTSLFRRIFEKILLIYINTDHYTRNLTNMNYGQAGFRPHYSSSSQALLLHCLITSNPHLRVIFLDLTSAYDRVPHTRVLEILASKHCPPRLLSIIYSLFTRCSTRFLVNHALTPPLPLFRGLLQGSLLSPCYSICSSTP